MKRIGLLLLAALCATPAAFAQTPPGTCTPITTVPFAIKEPGVYCVTKNLTTNMTSGRAISVEADDVILDLSGYTINGPLRDTSATTVGIYALDVQRLTIFGGTLRGFKYGVLIADSQGLTQDDLIANLRVLSSRASGIAVTGRHCTLLSNTVSSTIAPGAYAAGISLSGDLGILRRNQVVSTSTRTPGGFAAGVSLQRAGHAVVSGNVVSGVTGVGTRIGFRCGDPYKTFNTVAGAKIPFSVCSEPPPGPGYPYPYPYPVPFSSNHTGVVSTMFAMLLALGATFAKWGRA